MTLVRPATKSDLVDASRIYGEALRTADWLPRTHPKPIDFMTATDGEEVFVAANEKDEVTGFISVWTADSFVHHLYVDAVFRRSGVGTALVHSLEAWLPRPWSLKCVKANVAALRFYRWLGWQRAGEGVGDDGPYLLLRY